MIQRYIIVDVLSTSHHAPQGIKGSHPILFLRSASMRRTRHRVSPAGIHQPECRQESGLSPCRGPVDRVSCTCRQSSVARQRTGRASGRPGTRPACRTNRAPGQLPRESCALDNQRAIAACFAHSLPSDCPPGSGPLTPRIRRPKLKTGSGVRGKKLYRLPVRLPRARTGDR